MNFLFRATSLFFLLFSVLSADPVPTLRVLSYNIHHGAGLDGKLDLERIARVIKATSPDVVSLQEVDRKTTRSGGIDQAARLAELTGMKHAYGSSMPYQGGQYGNAILTNFKIVATKILALPGEPRSALCATLELPSKDPSPPRFHFIATHLDTKAVPRKASPPLIATLVQSLPNHPAILAGDLNARPDSPTLAALKKDWTNATAGPDLFTSPTAKPTSQIDYILTRPSTRWKVLKKEVIKESVASDHRPILAVLQWQK